MRGPVCEVAARFAEPPKGEITVVVGPDSTAAADEEASAAARHAVDLLVAAGTPRKVAAEVVSGLTGVPRNELYRSSL